MIRSISLALTVWFSLAAPSLVAQEFLGKKADAWTQQLSKSTDARQRRNAAFALGKMGKNAVPVLGDMQQAFGREKDAKVRDAIVFAMGDICRFTGGQTGNKDSLEKFFITALNDDNPYVKRSAAYALGCQETKSKIALAALDAALADTSPIVRQNAAWALGSFDVAGLPSLKRALNDVDSLVKRDAAGALLQVSDGDKVHELVKDILPLCRDGNSEVRRAALSVLVRVVDATDKEAIASLKWPLDNDRDLENKRNAALALSNIGGAETIDALPVLLEAIQNGDLELRRQAVAAIRNIGPKAKDAVELLKRLLRDDPDPEIRKNAALSLGGIGKAAESAIPVMVARIQDTKELRDIRARCAVSMQEMGPVQAAVDAVPALLQVVRNPNDDGRARGFVPWALRVHSQKLRTMNDTLDTFTTVLREPKTEDNRMLRYDCSYMLGMVWESEAPEIALDVLTDYLRDEKVLVYGGTESSVGPTGTERGQGGKNDQKFKATGDGRTMACDALLKIGAARYSRRPQIMNQLNILAGDKDTYEPLRKKVKELLKAAQ